MATTLVLNHNFSVDSSCKLKLKVHSTSRWHWWMCQDRWQLFWTQSWHLVLVQWNYKCLWSMISELKSWMECFFCFFWHQIVILLSKTQYPSIQGTNGLIRKAGKIQAYELLLHRCMCRFSVTTIKLPDFMNPLTGYGERDTSVHFTLEWAKGVEYVLQ